MGLIAGKANLAADERKCTRISNFVLSVFISVDLWPFGPETSSRSAGSALPKAANSEGLRKVLLAL